MKNIFLSRILLLALASLTAFVLCGCKHTTVTKTWTAPSTDSIHFTKVIVLALTKDDLTRKTAESYVKAQITKIPAVASYEIFPGPLDAQNKAKVLQVIKDSGADGLIVLRLLGTADQVTTGENMARPMEYQTFSGYYGAAYDMGAYYAEDRRDINFNRIFGIQTNIYNAKTDKLIWSGQTESKRDMTNDHDVAGLVTEVAEVVKSTLKSQDLIP